MILRETSGKHQACPDDSARPRGDRQEVRPTSTGICWRSPQVSQTGDSTPHEGGFLLRRVVPSLVSIQVWSSQLSTGFSTFPLAQREVAQSARSLNVGVPFKSRVRGVQRANTWVLVLKAERLPLERPNTLSLSSYCLDDTTDGTLVQAKRGRIVGESCAEINRSSIGHARLCTSVRDAMS